MKKILVLLLLLTNVLFLHAEETSGTKPEKKILTFLGKVMENGIRVREDKNVSSRTLGNLYKGEKISIFERTQTKEKIQDMEDYWYRIEYQGQKAWVYGHFLIVEEPVENLTGTVNTNNVHIRNEFDLGTQITGKVFKDDHFPVVSKTNKQLLVDDKQDFWYKILLSDNTYGWIFGEFLTLSTSTKK
ncbi:SH3 domain-containing protein [Candidatus Desantisbacteria bacterium]|nr:SH3 domain-containing protein [Candidatus Desantisbacteria bacterium]